MFVRGKFSDFYKTVRIYTGELRQVKNLHEKNFFEKIEKKSFCEQK